MPGLGAPKDWERLREEMIEKQLRKRGIRDPRVLDAMRRVPRHRFVPAFARHLAYEDDPLLIGAGQTISQPYIVAVMAQALELKGDERVLEVGAGSGYHAAVLAELAAEVWTIERDLSLAAMARRHLADAGYRRVRVVTGDGSLGYPDHAPYEAISVAAGAPVVPVRLLEQLDEDGGRMVIPLGPLDNQELRLIRRAAGGVQERFVDYCRFVPLCGALAWRRNA